MLTHTFCRFALATTFVCLASKSSRNVAKRKGRWGNVPRRHQIMRCNEQKYEAWGEVMVWPNNMAPTVTGANGHAI